MNLYCFQFAKCLWPAIICLFWSAGIMSRADTHYVSLGGANESPYTNGWTSAAREIQWAVDKAVASDTVLVSNGTYNLTNQIYIRTNIIVRSFTEQGHGTNDTFINGNYPTYTNRCFYMTNGVLDGFTISNGYADVAVGGQGGGMYLYLGASVLNCMICYNYSSNNADWSGGGGLYLESGYIGMVSNCTVISNTVLSTYAGYYGPSGGGIFMRGGLVIDSRITGNRSFWRGGGINMAFVVGAISNCTVNDNWSSELGGGIRDVYGAARIAHCVISNNVSGANGGGLNLNGGNDTVIYSTIIGNTTRNNGGGIHFVGGGLVSNCFIINNVSSNWVGGINIDNPGGRCEIIDSVIAGNTAPSEGAGVRIIKGGLMKNCLIYGNTNHVAVLLDKSTLNSNSYECGLINCTIVSNSWGIYARTATNYIVNCIVRPNAGYDIYNDTAANTNSYWYTCASNVLPPNQGNITNDPLFIDVTAGNCHLRPNSPCINRGMYQNWMTYSSDLDGRPRIRYGIVDMGAYECIYAGTIYTVY